MFERQRVTAPIFTSPFFGPTSIPRHGHNPRPYPRRKIRPYPRRRPVPRGGRVATEPSRGRGAAPAAKTIRMSSDREAPDKPARRHYDRLSRTRTVSRAGRSSSIPPRKRRAERRRLTADRLRLGRSRPPGGARGSGRQKDAARDVGTASASCKAETLSGVPPPSFADAPARRGEVREPSSTGRLGGERGNEGVCLGEPEEGPVSARGDRLLARWPLPALSGSLSRSRPADRDSGRSSCPRNARAICRSRPGHLDLRLSPPGDASPDRRMGRTA